MSFRATRLFFSVVSFFFLNQNIFSQSFDKCTLDLEISTFNPGMIVVLDGKPLDFTPLSIPGLACGKHSIYIGNTPNLTGRQDKPAATQNNNSILSISSDMGDASVRINNSSIESIPTEIRVTGSSKLKLELIQSARDSKVLLKAEIKPEPKDEVPENIKAMLADPNLNEDSKKMIRKELGLSAKGQNERINSLPKTPAEENGEYIEEETTENSGEIKESDQTKNRGERLWNVGVGFGTPMIDQLINSIGLSTSIHLGGELIRSFYWDSTYISAFGTKDDQSLSFDNLFIAAGYQIRLGRIFQLKAGGGFGFLYLTANDQNDWTPFLGWETSLNTNLYRRLGLGLKYTEAYGVNQVRDYYYIMSEPSLHLIYNF